MGLKQARLNPGTTVYLCYSCGWILVLNVLVLPYKCVLVCFCLYTDLGASMLGPCVIFSVNLLNILSRFMALSADCLSWELCFIMFGIFSFPVTIAISLPFSIYSAAPSIPNIAQKEVSHPGFGLLFTAIPERHYHCPTSILNVCCVVFVKYLFKRKDSQWYCF